MKGASRRRGGQRVCLGLGGAPKIGATGPLGVNDSSAGVGSEGNVGSLLLTPVQLLLTLGRSQVAADRSPRRSTSVAGR